MAPGPFDTLGDVPTEDSRGQEGKLLAGRYRILRKLGEGGMGLVYLAEDSELANHRVAIKFIPPMLAGNVRAIKNLQREALTAMQLTHPNIVRLHDLHTDGHQKFLVMEYVAGKTLDDLLAQKEGEKIPLRELLPIAEQIAAALDHAHGQNVLHRDLKPSNIMIADDGTVRLLDFGIAREMKDSFTRVTGQETSGTLPYMSPEQLMGERPSPAMDIYSFGAVLYECLTGHPPFYMGDIREQIKSKSAQPIEGVNALANEVILSALSKQAAQRPHSAQDLVTQLKTKPPAAAPPRQEEPKVPEIEAPTRPPVASRPVSASKPERSRGWIIALIALACLGGGLALYGLLTQPTPKPARVPPDRSQERQASVPARLPSNRPQDRQSPTPDAETERAVSEVVGGPVAGQGWTVPDLDLELVYVEAGSFEMGSNDGYADERPVHTVRISRGFWIGQYEVTQSQYEELMGQNPSSFKGANLPVETVSWNEATDFCGRLTERERQAGRLPQGYVYRLPTEAEWEYAARGGAQGRGFTYAGSNYLDEVAWHDGNSGHMTHPVGQKRPNELGLYDMSGNVWEWCHDCYDADYYGQSLGSDPTGPSSGSARVLRGGSWCNLTGLCRSSGRRRGAPQLTFLIVGFRVAVSVAVD